MIRAASVISYVSDSLGSIAQEYRTIFPGFGIYCFGFGVQGFGFRVRV